MATEAQLQDDLRRAMKARTMEQVYALRGLLTEIKNLKVEKRVDTLSEEEIAAVVRKEAKKRAEAAEFAEKAGRTELVEENHRQQELLEAYLPAQLSEDDLSAAVREIAAEVGSKQIGPIMAKLRERFAGRYDAKLASELIRKLT